MQNIIEKLNIKSVPALVWGANSEKVIIAVHGNLSDKVTHWFHTPKQLNELKNWLEKKVK